MRWDNPRERLRKFDRVFDNIRRESREGAVILVEGERDENALREFGIKGEIVQVSGNGKSLYATVERISKGFDDAILLTDWDTQGEDLNLKLKNLLEVNGVVPNTIHRKRLRNLTSKEVYDVESLVAYRRNMENEL